MEKCKKCGNEIQSVVGRRKKEFCSNSCRASFNQKKNGGKKKYVRIETFQELFEKYRNLQMEYDLLKNQPIKEEKNEIKPKEGMPIQEKGEKRIDYLLRLTEWKEKQNN